MDHDDFDMDPADHSLTDFNRILSSANLVELIYEVKKRPIIWDSGHEDFCSKLGRKKAWESIMLSFYPQYHCILESQKYALERHFLRKWKSLRDCLRRELSRRSPSTSKPYTYLYSEHLQFLLPHIKNGPASPLGRPRSKKNSSEAVSPIEFLDADNNTSNDADVAEFEELPIDDIFFQDDSSCNSGTDDAKSFTVKSSPTTDQSDTILTRSKMKRLRTESAAPPSVAVDVKRSKPDKRATTSTSSSSSSDSQRGIGEDSVAKMSGEALLKDVDTLFLLSMVQDLKDLPELIKLETKSELLQVVMQARIRLANSST